MNSGSSHSNTRTGSSTKVSAHGAQFSPTSWTAVVAAGRPDTSQARDAVAKLCESYWRPLHAYIRRLGYSEDDAQDLTQEFLLRLMTKNVFASADRNKGRFRTFLLTALKFFLTNEYHRTTAAKRGGGKIVVSLDEQSEDSEPRYQPVSTLSPAAIYDQTWAKTVFGQAEARLGEEYAAVGKTDLFEHLKPFLEGVPGARGYHAVAGKLQMTPNAVGVAVYRMRQRLGQLIRTEIANTLANPAPTEVEDEMRFLIETLGR